jgi:cyclic pyranopterin phosphate synthase
MLADSFGRGLSYLRISVTDRCNLRCVYCMPEAGVEKRSHQAIMRYEEIAELVRVFAGLGVRTVRITGGEPLVRPDLHKLVEMIAKIDGITDLGLTTNAILLANQAEKLSGAGLKRINVSLDTLQDEKFRKICRFGSLADVWRGIEAAEKHGLNPVKLNVVAMRGVNDDEFIDLARLTYTHPWAVRFIELMPIGNQMHWGAGFPEPQDAYIPAAEIRTQLEPLGLTPLAHKNGSGPARYYQLKGATGKVGFITAVSEHFCASCNRLRLTADGHLRPCLLNDVEIPLLEAMRRGEPLLPLIRQAVWLKPDRHHIDEDLTPEERKMKEIGG